MAFTAQRPNRAWKAATCLASIKFWQLANLQGWAGSHERDQQRFHNRHPLAGCPNETWANYLRKSQDVRLRMLSRLRFEYVPVDSSR